MIVVVCFFQLPHLCHRPEILTSAGWKKDTLASGSSILCVSGAFTSSPDTDYDFMHTLQYALCLS